MRKAGAPAPAAQPRAGDAAVGGELPLKHAPRPTTPAITAADLMTRVYVFADDSMLGREVGTVGNVRGNAYIARELARLGLRPAGDSGSYFQALPLVRRGFDQQARLVVGPDTLRFGADFLAAPARGTPRSIDGAAVVYGGELAGGATLPISAEQAAGKLVIVSVANLAALQGGASPAALAGAAGVAIVVLDQLPAQFRGFFTRTQTVVDSAAYQAALEPMAPAGDTPLTLLVSRAAAERLLGAPLAGAAPGAAGRTVAGTVAFRTERAPATNVVAVLPGRDPALGGQYVALGAHNDHVGLDREVADHDSLRIVLTVTRPQGADSPERPTTGEERARIRAMLDSVRARRPARPDSVYNGADDDASGSMALLEVAEAMVGARPRRSVLFVWHTGEEAGLYGSLHFTDHPTVPRDSIVAQLNVDMIGRGTAADLSGGGPGYVQLIGSRRLSTELGDLVEAVNRAQRTPFTFDYQYDANGHPQQYYCRSDHYAYARYGIPVVFLSTGGHRDYHQLTDEPQYLDYAKYARVTQLLHDVARRVADRDARPVVDKAKPDPRGQCVQ